MHIFLFTHNRVGDVKKTLSPSSCMKGTFPSKYYLNLVLKLQYSDWITLWSHKSHNVNPRSYIEIQCLKYYFCCWYKILHVHIFQGLTVRRFTVYDLSTRDLKSSSFFPPFGLSSRITHRAETSSSTLSPGAGPRGNEGQPPPGAGGRESRDWRGIRPEAGRRRTTQRKGATRKRAARWRSLRPPLLLRGWGSRTNVTFSKWVRFGDTSTRVTKESLSPPPKKNARQRSAVHGSRSE